MINLNCAPSLVSVLFGTPDIYSVETLTGIKFITWTLGVFVKNPESG
jgi:hypothetical protein